MLPGRADDLHHRRVSRPARAEVDLRVEERIGQRMHREHTRVLGVEPARNIAAMANADSVTGVTR